MKRTQLNGEELKALRLVPATPSSPNRLRVAMAMLDLTQNDVAQGTSLTQATISDIYNFKVRDVKLATLRALADFFHCSIDDLFPRVGEAPADQPILPFKAKAVAAR